MSFSASSNPFSPLHAEAFEHALHFGEAVAQGLLALSELLIAGIGAALVGLGLGLALVEIRGRSGVVRLALVVLSGPRASLSALPLAIALVAAEGVVAQRLLVAQKLPELVHLLAHRPVGGALLGLARAAHVLEHLLQLIEHGLGLVARAVARRLLHAVHQLVEILRLLVRVLLALLAVPLGVPRHFAGEAPGRLPQVLHQLPDLVIARAALQRLSQRLFGGAQIALGLRGVAVLDLLGHRPEKRRDVEEVGVGARGGERGLRLLQPEIDVGGRVEQLRRDAQARQRRRRRAFAHGRDRE